jgi:phage baseplate assembly protein W
MRQIQFPYRIDGRGRTAASAHADHVRQLIEQAIFTSPGERVNRPDFGSGLLQLVFAPNSPELASATQFQVQGDLQQVLDELVRIDAVSVRVENATLVVEVRYALRTTGEERLDRFTQSLNGMPGGVPA